MGVCLLFKGYIKALLSHVLNRLHEHHTKARQKNTKPLSSTSIPMPPLLNDLPNVGNSKTPGIWYIDETAGIHTCVRNNLVESEVFGADRTRNFVNLAVWLPVGDHIPPQSYVPGHRKLMDVVELLDGPSAGQPGGPTRNTISTQQLALDNIHRGERYYAKSANHWVWRDGNRNVDMISRQRLGEPEKAKALNGEEVNYHFPPGTPNA